MCFRYTRAKKYQDRVEYGTIDLIREDIPNAKISIQVDCGMAEGYKQYEINKAGKWTAINYKTVRNYNLDKSKEKKTQKEGAK